MKCGACCAENPNEASFCKSCGRNIRDTHINDVSKKGIWTIPILLCFAVFIAACVMGYIRLGKLFEKHTITDQFTPIKSSSVVYYNDMSNTVYTYSSPTQSGTREKIDLYTGSKFELIEKGNDCSVVRAGGSYYCISKEKMIKLTNMSDYMMDKNGTKLVYLTESHNLYQIANGSKTLISDLVLQYVISEEGNYVAYLRDDMSAISSDNNVIVSIDKNAFYIDGKEAGIESLDAKSAYMMCANSLGFYYVTDESQIRLIANGEDGTYKTYPSSNKIEKLVAVGSSSILYAAKDGYTYLWNGTEEETLFANKPLSSIITPYGYRFTGDNYNKLIYGIDSDNDGENDTAVYIDENGKCSELLCKNAKALATAADSSFLYYLDNKSTLRKIALTNSIKDKVCANDVISFIVSPDIEGVWYLKNDGLYEFDGMLSKCVKKLSDVENFVLSQYGYILIETDTALLLYDGEVKVITADKSQIEGIGLSYDLSYYVDSQGLHLACEDGSFKTEEEIAALQKKQASDNADEI